MKPLETKKGPTYANVTQINRKSKTHREESLTHEDGTAQQTQSKDVHCTPLESSPLDASNKSEAHGVADVKTAEKQENKDHVYAIVHKDNTGRAERAASVHARTPSSKRLEPASRARSAAEPVDSSSSADPANHSDERPYSVELVNHSQEKLVGDEKKDYLYAVVDKANKKKRPPQVITTGKCFFVWLSVLFLAFFLIQAFGNIDQRFLFSLDLPVTTIILRSLKNNSKSREGYLSKN